MKKLFNFFPVMVLLFLFTSCEPDNVQPQTADSAISSADAKKADNYTAHLRPEEETNQPVVSNATGQIILKLSKDGTQLYYKLIVANIETVVAAHLHLGAEGVSGPVVVPLFAAPAGSPLVSPQGILAEGIITSSSLTGSLKGKTLTDLIAAIEAGLIYTNVHSVKYPGGEIRGQVK
ncbi:hypothetical protein AAE02nite_48580 [Adhaeribacter aerolatus]|uniref:CHRD domain-containing protein n=1 Tax=Adhaeribacter aerolatus TaxID=670289 RepID=A0A512B5H2_9BACT|nr:CHRD domain-containing protein [Adhaeribacter aerolatus]GEO07194.1 hypothetical protein AAE02nite_48580 [Adhaeribacter aerolatus]